MQLDAFERLSLAHLPTPIEPLPHLTTALGGPQILVKRDDCTGLAFGGNKTRKLEYAMAAALAESADCVITAGGLQSNHVRQTAAAAAKLGLHCVLVLDRNVPDRDEDYARTGNMLLDRLLGAEVHIEPAGVDRTAVMEDLARRQRSEGRTPYIIPTGASYPIGALGLVNCALEFDQQAKEQDLAIDAVVHASGSGGTQAGLIAGCLAAGGRTRVIGIDIDADLEAVRSAVTEIADETLSLLGISTNDLKDHVDIRGGYGGPAYGLPTEAMHDAILRAARMEGLLLDPVYSGKAFAGLIDLVERGAFEPTETVLFLHTGGLPALFAYRALFDED